MVDWKRRCLELAEMVVSEDMVLIYTAMELIELGKRDEKAQKKFMEHWRCTDKKESERLYAEYLELIR